MIKGKHFVVFIITMPNPVSYNSSTTPAGTFKRSNVSYGLMPTNYGIGYGSLSWYNSLDTTSKYVIVSDTYTLGLSTQGNAKPVMWSTGNTSNQNLINLINGLPGNTNNFTDYYEAVNWLQGTNKFLLLNNGYENIVTNGLVLNLDAAWWNSYPTSGTTWTDLSGNNYNGTLTNGPTYNSSNGGSIVFDGVDDYVSTNYSGGTFTTLTLSAWIYKTNTTRAYILNSASPYGFGFEFYETTMYFNVQGSGAQGYGEFDFNNTGWNYWVMVYNGADVGNSNRLKAYRNGVQEVLTYVNTIPASFISTGNFVLGRRPWFISYSQCNIATTQIYNRALTASEVLQNYNTQKSRFGL